MLERAPEEESGGNSRFTAGLMRVVYNGVEDLKQVIELSADEIARSDFGTYTEEQFFDDMARVTEFRCDPDLTEILVKQSLPTVVWMRENGMRFTAAWGRQAFNIGGRFVLGRAHGRSRRRRTGACRLAHPDGAQERRRNPVRARAVSLVADDAGVHGVVGKHGENENPVIPLGCPAAGGFQANTEWRTRYLGPGWSSPRCAARASTPATPGMALDIGAAAYGNWSGCHAVAWDRNAPRVRRPRRRPVPEAFVSLGPLHQCRGAALRRRGRGLPQLHLRQVRPRDPRPASAVRVIFDAKVKAQLRDEYRIKQVTKRVANTLEELVKQLEDTNGETALKEIQAYNKAVRADIAFNPNVKDGRRTEGLAVPKSNWANTIDTPPFEAYAVTCGITSLRRPEDQHRCASDQHDGEPISGLYAAGELVGGIFWFNYPGLRPHQRSVFGRIAGKNAALQRS